MLSQHLRIKTKQQDMEAKHLKYCEFHINRASILGLFENNKAYVSWTFIIHGVARSESPIKNHPTAGVSLVLSHTVTAELFSASSLYF